MFRKLLQNKSFRRSAILITLALLYVIFAVSTAYAQPAPTPTTAGAGSVGRSILAGAEGGAAAVMLVYIVLYAIQTVLQQFITIFGTILGVLFNANTATSFLTSEFIVKGWEIMRDLANGFFILMLLWIAFTIIFSLENLGGRKFLVRIVTVALLVNFSFTLVSIAFGFANSLAIPFQKAIGKDPGGLIVGKLQLQTTLAALDPSAAKALESNYAAAENQQKVAEQIKLQQEEKAPGFGSLPNYLIPQANAALPLALAGIFTFSTLLSVVKVTAAAIAATAVTYVAWGGILSMSINSFFLLIIAFAMATACIVLIFRLVAMAFLAVLAPVAFLAYAVPGGQVQQYFHKWVSQLLRWAFYLPAFYFLLWVSFSFLDAVTNEKGEILGLPNIQQFSVNFPAMLVLLIFVGMLYATIILARQMGITVADGFINWGKKFGKGAVTGALGFAGGAVAGAVVPRLGSFAGKAQEDIGKIQNATVRRVLTLTGVTPGLRKVATVSRERIGQAEKEVKEMNAREIKRQFAAGGFLTREKNMAAARRLQEMGDLGAEGGIEGYNPAMLDKFVENTWAQGGEWQSFAKVLPQLAKNKYLAAEQLKSAEEGFLKKFGRAAQGDEAAVWHIWNKIKPPDMPKMDFSTTFDDSVAGQLNTKMYLMTARGEHHSQFARTNPAKAQAVIGDLQTKNPDGAYKHADVIKGWNRGQYAYWRTNAARELGLSGLLPADAEKPTEVVQEESLRTEADTLRLDVRQKEHDLEQLEKLVRREEELNIRLRALTDGIAGITDDRERVRLQNEINKIQNIDLPIIGRQKEESKTKGGVATFEALDTKLRQGLEETRNKLREKREQLRNMGATYGGSVEF